MSHSKLTALLLLPWLACCRATLASIEAVQKVNATCSADGQLQSATEWRTLVTGRQAGIGPIWIRVEAEDRTVRLDPMPRIGVVGATFIDSDRTFVLKGEFSPPSRYGCAQREICVYRRIAASGFHWAPQMLCSDESLGILLMAHAGPAVSTANLPSQYRQQAEQILTDMKTMGLRHNDLVKRPRAGVKAIRQNHDGSYSYPPGILEMTVKDGALVIFDFNWATINGSFQCAANLSARASRYFRPRADGDALLFLETIHQRKLELEEVSKHQTHHTTQHHQARDPASLQLKLESEHRKGKNHSVGV